MSRRTVVPAASRSSGRAASAVGATAWLDGVASEVATDSLLPDEHPAADSTAAIEQNKNDGFFMSLPPLALPRSGSMGRQQAGCPLRSLLRSPQYLMPA